MAIADDTLTLLTAVCQHISRARPPPSAKIETMGPSSRLFEIIQILRSANAALPARAIAEGVGVTKRTIYRDIATLQGMRIPIEGEAGVGYVM